MAYIYNIRHDRPRVGRSQGVLIFWGLVSAVFAALFCYYFLKDHENEQAADKYRDDVMTLQEQRDTLSAEKDKLQASISDREDELKTHEDFLQEKEATLAAEEARLGVLAQQTQNPSGQLQMQAATVKKFSDAIRQLATNEGSDVVIRGGHPVLRISNTVFFAPGDATLTADGKAALSQIAQTLNGQAANFELRIETFTDADAEGQSAPAAKTADGQKEAVVTTTPGAVAWDLTAGRAVAITRYFHDQDLLPFPNVLVIARGDSEPIVTKAKADHARNRRLEIMLAPVPGALPSSDPVTAASDPGSSNGSHAAADAGPGKSAK